MERVANKLIDSTCEYFDDVISQTMRDVKARVADVDHIESADVVASCLMHMLSDNIWRLMNKTYIYEFHKYRESIGLKVDKDSTVAFDKYLKLFSKDEIAGWFEKYKVLHSMVEKSVINTCGFILRVLDDYLEDRDSFEEELGIPEAAKLVRFLPMGSDPHNKGAIVLKAEFDNGRAVIYKSRDFDADKMLQKIYREVIIFPETGGFAPVPDCINRGDHGWAKFIENSMIDEGDVGEAFYRLGLYAPIFSCFASTDIHDENIIFDGINPYFIDLETIMQPEGKASNEPLIYEMQKKLTHSIANTSVVPAKLMANTLNYLIGAINTPYPQDTEESFFGFKNVGTDAIDIAKEKAKVDRIANPLKVKTDKVIDPVDYMKDFLRGYRKGYKEILNHKDEIIELMKEFNGHLRTVLRPTAQYFMIIDACVFPENLYDEESVKKVLGYMKPVVAMKGYDEAETVLHEEWDAMLEGDIPYFYIRGNEKNIEINDYKTKDIYPLSPVENAIENLKSLTEKDLLFDERMIVEGFSEIKIRNAKVNGKKYPSDSELFGELWNSIRNCDVDKIYKFYEELAVKSMQQEEKSAGWFGGVYGDIPYSYNSISLVSLHDTGGIPVMMKDLIRYAEDIRKDKDGESSRDIKKYRKLYEEALRGMQINKKCFADTNYITETSIISGKSSLDMILGYDGNEEDRVKAIEECVRNSKDENVGDIYLGKAGLYLFLASNKDTDRDIMIKADRELKEALDKGDFMKFGLAHGELGLLWARYRVCRFLDDRDACVAIYKRVRELIEEYDNIGNGWCNGNSGILMILAEMMTLEELQKEVKFLREFAKKTAKVKKGVMQDLSICHGISGMIQSLVYCYFIYGDPIYIDLADEYWNDVCDTVEKESYYIGEVNRDYLMGYFLGWSGLIDSVILLNICKKEKEDRLAKLWIPLNLSTLLYQQKIRQEGGY